MFVANLPQQPQWNTRIWNMAMHKSLIDKPQQMTICTVRAMRRARVKVTLRHTYVVLRMRRLVRHSHDLRD